MTIEQLAVKYGSDKRSEIHGFTKWYENYFKDIRVKKILEIGVFGGASVKMWYDYFKEAKIIGIDIDPALTKYENDRTSIYIGDQADERFLGYVASMEKCFDVIIDDGGHTMKQQVTSFETLFHSLVPGGLYVIEDLHTSYWKEWQDNDGITMIGILQSLIHSVQIEGLNGYGDPFSKASMADNTGYGYEKAHHEAQQFSRHIEWIHIYKSIAFIKKRDRPI